MRGLFFVVPVHVDGFVGLCGCRRIRKRRTHRRRQRCCRHRSWMRRKRHRACTWRRRKRHRTRCNWRRQWKRRWRHRKRRRSTWRRRKWHSGACLHPWRHRQRAWWRRERSSSTSRRRRQGKRRNTAHQRAFTNSTRRRRNHSRHRGARTLLRESLEDVQIAAALIIGHVQPLLRRLRYAPLTTGHTLRILRFTRVEVCRCSSNNDVPHTHNGKN